MRLHELTADARWRERAGALVAAFAGGALELGLHGAAFLLAVDWYLNPGTHLVVVGEAEEEVADEMHRRALAGFAPRRVVQRLTPEDAAVEGRLPPAIAGTQNSRPTQCRYSGDPGFSPPSSRSASPTMSGSIRIS